MRGFRVLLALSLALISGRALAQVNPGTSPLSGAKGGTGNAFMQFTGPATSLKTFTLPNANSTLATTPVPNSALATMPAYTSKCNNTGGAAVPTDCDATAFTLKASPVTNDIVVIQDSGASFAYKKTTVGALASAGSVASVNTATGAITIAGSNGVILTTSGAANTVTLEQLTLGGRLTFSGVPCIFSTDQLAQTALTYGVCNGGKYVPVFDGTNMKMVSLQPGGDGDAVGYTLTLGSNWAASSVFDVYLTLSGLCTVQWTNSSTRATAIAGTFKGVPTNATLATCRTTNSTTISMAANQGTLVAWFQTNTNAGQIDFKFGTAAANGGAACICMGNVFNPQPYTATVIDSTNVWTQTQGQTWQQKDSQNGGGGNQAVVLQGLAGTPTKVSNFGVSNASTASAEVGIGIDTCSSNSADVKLPNTSGLTAYLPTTAIMTRNLTVGSHTLCAEEQTGAGTTVTSGRIGVSASGNQSALRVEGYF